MDVPVQSMVRLQQLFIQKLIGEGWNQKALELHKQVRSEMPDDQRHWLLPKEIGYFDKILCGQNSALLGVLDGEMLAGFMAVLADNNFAIAHAEGRITIPDDGGKLSKLYGEGKVAVCQSLAVLNKYFGRGISRHLVRAYIEWAQTQKCQHLFTQIADQNFLSWLRFLQEDFALCGTWVAGHRRFFLRHLQPAEKSELVENAKPQDKHSFAKDQAIFPAMLTELTAKVASGKFVVLVQPDDRAALHFVCGKHK